MIEKQGEKKYGRKKNMTEKSRAEKKLRYRNILINRDKLDRIDFSTRRKNKCCKVE